MFVFTDKSSTRYADVITKSIVAADENAELWENGVETTLTPEQVNNIVPASVRDLKVQEHGQFCETLRDGWFDVDEQGYVHNVHNQVVARI